MTTKRVRTTVAAVLLTGSLAGGVLATAAPALASPAAATASTTAAGSATPIVGSAATSRQVVAAWYARFLDAKFPIDRYPGSGYWIERLDRGDAPASVVADLRTTREYASDAVTSIYAAYLNRTPDTGADYWIDGVASGAFPIEWVEQNVAASGEYLLRTSTDGARPGGSRGDASDVSIEGWYSVVLKRSPSTGERAYWLGRFGSDSALGVFRQLWYTPEAVTARIQSHYGQLLGRSAQPGEVAYWYGRETASDAAVIAAIASSPEYADRTR